MADRLTWSEKVEAARVEGRTEATARCTDMEQALVGLVAATLTAQYIEGWDRLPENVRRSIEDATLVAHRAIFWSEDKAEGAEEVRRMLADRSSFQEIVGGSRG